MANGPNILLVEQGGVPSGQLLGCLLEIYKDGYDCVCTNKLDVALDAIDAKGDGFFDICFVDSCTSSTSGLNIVEKITGKANCKAPVIFVNEQDEMECDAQAAASGAADYLLASDLNPRFLKRVIRYATDKRGLERSVEYLSFHDSLTGLPNRVLLQDRLAQVLARVRRRRGFAALIFFDLDNFKTINDSFGHSIGDILLQEVATRLQGCCREEDTVARLGGDEFVILLPDMGGSEECTIRGAREVSDKIFQAIAEEVMIEGHEFHITASLGVAVVNKNSLGVDQILRQADTALYEAKSVGKDSCSFFVPRMEEAVIRQVQIEAQIRNGLKADEFTLHYQPINDTQSSQLVGAEALVRWNNPVLGQVSPGEFIPIAESCGLIWPLGERILEEACEFLVATPGLPQLSVNISSEQILRPSFVPFVENLIQETGVETGRLIFELTETALLADLGKAATVMAKLRAKGIRFALDDFGTGYSSLSYLKKLPFDYVKIDGSFTRDVLDNTEDQAIIEAIIGLSEALGFSVTAEGVETAEQLAYLKEKKCTTVQGYFFSKPVPADEFFMNWTCHGLVPLPVLI